MTRTLIFLLALVATQAAAAATVLLDSIVAIVDESIITQRELDNRVYLIKLDFRQTKRRLPDEDTVYRQVLDALIDDSLLLQQADKRGIKITDSQLNQTMQNIAKQNKMSLSDYRQVIIADGLDYDRYRETVHRELIISTLRRQYGQRNASICESEIEDFIRQTANDTKSFEYLLSHILIALPDAASPEQVGKAQATAAEIITLLDQGRQFDELANTYSSDNNALEGGNLGWRKKAEIPSIFTTKVLKMKPGEYSAPIRSASGLHIVFLKETRDLEQVLTKQFNSRHILIRSNELITEEEARTRLVDFRQRILEGEDFARLARLYSVDFSTGSQGGELGWKEDQGLVPEYVAAAAALQPGEISEPFRSQFGWHILELLGRRTVDETTESKRNKIHTQLLQQKQNEVFDLWKRQLRDEAYVVYPDKPA